MIAKLFGWKRIDEWIDDEDEVEEEELSGVDVEVCRSVFVVGVVMEKNIIAGWKDKGDRVETNGDQDGRPHLSGGAEELGQRPASLARRRHFDLAARRT